MVTKLAQMRSRDLLGPFWDHLGTSRGLSGPLGVSGDPRWDHLGASRGLSGPLEASWDHLGTIMEPSWNHLGTARDDWGLFGNTRSLESAHRPRRDARSVRIRAIYTHCDMTS